MTVHFSAVQFFTQFVGVRTVGVLVAWVLLFWPRVLRRTPFERGDHDLVGDTASERGRDEDQHEARTENAQPHVPSPPPSRLNEKPSANPGRGTRVWRIVMCEGP